MIPVEATTITDIFFLGGGGREGGEEILVKATTTAHVSLGGDSC